MRVGSSFGLQPSLSCKLSVVACNTVPPSFHFTVLDYEGGCVGASSASKRAYLASWYSRQLATVCGGSSVSADWPCLFGFFRVDIVEHVGVLPWLLCLPLGASVGQACVGSRQLPEARSASLALICMTNVVHFATILDPSRTDCSQPSSQATCHTSRELERQQLMLHFQVWRPPTAGPLQCIPGCRATLC